MAVKNKKSNQSINRDQLVDKAVELKKSGHLESYVCKQLTELATGRFTGDEIQEIMLDSVRIIAENYFSRAKDIRLLHVSRYNKEINRLLKTSELDESLIGKSITYKQWLTSRERKIKAFDKALDTISQLESILGLSTITHEVDVNSEINVNVELSPKKYDVTKLSFEEQVELMELMQKAKKGTANIESVTEVVDDLEIITEDVKAEILPANVESIKRIQLEEKESGIQAKTSDEVVSLLKERLRIAAAKRIMNLGCTLDEKEKKLANSST